MMGARETHLRDVVGVEVALRGRARRGGDEDAEPHAEPFVQLRRKPRQIGAEHQEGEAGQEGGLTDQKLFDHSAGEPSITVDGDRVDLEQPRVGQHRLGQPPHLVLVVAAMAKQAAA